MFFVFGVSLCDLILNKCKEGWFAIQTMGKIWIDSKVRNQKRSQHSDTNTSNDKCKYKIDTMFSDLVTQLTVPDKLRNSNHDIEGW